MGQRRITVEKGISMEFSTTDLDTDLLRRAFSGWSFSPERRGQQIADDYVKDMQATYAAWQAMATTDEAHAYVEQAMADYKAGYIAKLHAWANASSRCVSTMIAGPANFNVRRAEKANASERKRSDEWHEWAAKTRQRVEAKLKDMRPAETKDAEHREQIRRKIMSRHMVANVVGIIERMAARGEVEDVEYALEVLRERNIVTARHGVWKAADTARKVAALHAQREQQAQTDGPATIAFDGGVIIDNALDNRVQIKLDDRPSEAMRTALKRSGWRWAPSTGCWQRIRTPNALYSAKQICGVAR
jgi:hypothetical protein